MDIGTIGVWLPYGFGTEGVAEIQQLGYGALWLGGSPSVQDARAFLGLRNYTANLLRFGFTGDDLANGGSDRLIDAVIPHGTPEQIAVAVRAHLDAGADHVCVQPLGARAVPVDDLRALAAVLL